MPEPILVSIAAALAAKGIQSVYDLVKKKFGNRKEAKAALEAAQDAAPNSPEVRALAAELERAEADDPQFAVELRQLWQAVSAQQAGDNSVNNQLSGIVTGNVLQARTIQGNVSFG
jgi:hypothetical protein